MQNLSELKTLFYQEHVKDRRLTLINYILIACIIALVVSVLIYIGADLKGLFSGFINQGGDDKSFTTLYPIIATIVAFTCVCGYPFFLLWKINKRPKKIEQLIERASEGTRLSSVFDHIEYKITIPILKINFKLCPITFVTILLEGDTKPYVLPLHKAYIPDMKILLSGASVEDINKHKAELYGDTDESTGESENIVSTPLKTVEEFRTFIDKELKDDIKELESSRKSSYKTMIIGGIITGILIVVVMGYVFYNSFTNSQADYTFNPMTSIVPIFVLGFVITMIMNFAMRKKNTQTQTSAIQSLAFGNNSFKEKIISRMVAFVNPSVKYIPMAHLALEDIFQSGLFTQRNYTVDGSDQISGKHNGVPFIMCDLDLRYKRNFSEENEEPDGVFYGQFFVARFNKKFNHPVYVISTAKGTDTRDYLDYTGEQVKLEDPEFMKMFRVYADDQVEARYILTPSLMERLKELAKRAKGNHYIAFYNNKITVANNSGINNFEAGFSQSITKRDNALLIGFYTDLCNQFAIIDELKLNINIWKKL